MDTLSGRASVCAAIALIAAVRVAVIQLPPMTASVRPVRMSDSTIRLSTLGPLVWPLGTRPNHFMPVRFASRRLAGLAWNTWPLPMFSTDLGAASAVPRACAANAPATISRKRSSDSAARATSASER